jgi:hypothetical protein
MKQLLISSLLVSFFIAGRVQALAQGCSDAGFCTAGALQHSKTTDSLTARSIGLSLTLGNGEHGVSIFVPQAEWKRQLGRSWNVEAKLSYYIASGNLGTHSGLGDPIVTVTRSWMLKSNWRLFATTGIRASLSDGSTSDEKGRPLPMPYQQGLGTTDLIGGLAAQYRHWLFLSVGYQQPVLQYNNNAYLAEALPQEEAEYKSYFDSRKLERRGDVLIRAEGMYARRQWSFAGGPLLIYHLGNDHITDLLGQDARVEGSKGLTLNLAAKLGYIKGRSHWEIGGGAPIVYRKARPDGLTRHWLITLRYERSLK